MTFRFVIKSTRDFSSIDMFLTYENIIKWIDAFSISHLCQFQHLLYKTVGLIQAKFRENDY